MRAFIRLCRHALPILGAVLVVGCSSRPPFRLEVPDATSAHDLRVRLRSRDGTTPLVRQVRVATPGRSGRLEGGHALATGANTAGVKGYLRRAEEAALPTARSSSKARGDLAEWIWHVMLDAAIQASKASGIDASAT